MTHLTRFCFYISLLLSYTHALQAVCPIVTNALNTSQSICSGDAIDFSLLQNAIGIDNVANPSFIGFAWYSDAALTQVITSSNFDIVGANTCQAQTTIVYVAILCSEQPEAIAAGQLTINIYPEPPSPIQSSDCQLLVSDLFCGGNLVIEYLQPNSTWANTPAISQPTNGATAVWRAYIAGAPDLDNDGFPDCMRSGTSLADDCPCIQPLPPSPSTNDTLITCDNTPNSNAFGATAGIGTTINWYNAANALLAVGNTYTPIIAGNYYAVATAPDGLCNSEPTVFVLQTEAAADASFTYPNNLTCVGDAPFLPNFIATPNGTFSILGNLSIDALSGAITPNIAGSYIVSHTVTGNCPDTDLEIVTIDACCPTITSPLAANYVLCNGGNTPIDFAAYENTVTYNDPNNNFVAFAWFSDIGLNNPLTPAAYTHTGINTCLSEVHNIYLGIICANQSQAIAAGSLQITVIPTPDINVLSPVGGCSLQITENCVGTLNIEYLQANGTWANTIPDINPSEGQTADWRAFVPNAPDYNSDNTPDCFVASTVTAQSCNCIAPPAPIAIIDTITACAATPNFQALVAQAPNNASFVIWRNEAGNEVATGNVYVPSTGGVYYAQSASIADTCLGGQIAAYFIQSPLADAEFAYSDTVFCANGTTITPIISGDAGGIFTASNNLSIDANTGAILLNQAGNYSISYTVGLACPAQSTLNLQLNSNTMSLSAGIDVAVCAGDTLILQGVAEGALWSEWSGSGTFVQSDNDTTAYIPSTANTFDLVLTAQSPCGVLQQDTVNVTAQAATTFSVFPIDTTIVAGTGILLQTEGATNIVWEDDPSLTCTHCTETVAYPTQTTTYAVYSLEQCVLPQIITVTVTEPQPIIPPDTLVVPNAFSPNKDGNNDEFIPTISGNLLAYHLQVFNRWGNLLFDTDIPQFGWDGTNKGKLCDIDTYVYIIDYQLENQTPQTLKGYTLLLR